MKLSILNFISNVSAESGISGDDLSKVQEEAPSTFEQLLPTLFMIAVFGLFAYFFIIRPEKKKKKAAQEQRETMRVGDTVITIGGITGEIEVIRNETITIFTGNNSIDVQKWAIHSVQPCEASDEEAE